MPPKRTIAKETLEQLYVVEGLTQLQVAKRLHTSLHTVIRNLDEHGIPRRTNYDVHLRHAMCYTRPYHIWQALKTRCTNTKQPNYRNYGGRGIAYPPAWETFDGFWADMADGYADDKSIDRIDNNQGYSKTNCRWADLETQNSNKSNAVLLTYHGRTQCITAWAKELGVRRGVLYHRKTDGWSDERILTEPVHTDYIRGRRVTLR